MTTSTRVVAARDLFVDNDVFLLSRGQYPSTPALGGMAWLRREPPGHAHLMALTTAVAAIKRALPTYRLSLLGAHTAPQPDSAVTRHRRLWKSFEARGVSIPRGARTEEISAAERGGIKWRGAITIDVEDVAQAMAIIDAEAASLPVAAPANVIDQMDDLVAKGWTSSSQCPPPEVLDSLCPQDGIALWPVGAFDDIESGVVAFSSPGIIKLLEGIST